MARNKLSVLRPFEQCNSDEKSLWSLWDNNNQWQVRNSQFGCFTFVRTRRNAIYGGWLLYNMEHILFFIEPSISIHIIPVSIIVHTYAGVYRSLHNWWYSDSILFHFYFICATTICLPKNDGNTPGDRQCAQSLAPTNISGKKELFFFHKIYHFLYVQNCDDSFTRWTER